MTELELRSSSQLLSLATTLPLLGAGGLPWTPQPSVSDLRCYSQLHGKLPQYRVLSHFLWPVPMSLRATGQVSNLAREGLYVFDL